ncbi:MAG: lactonase family protein [Leptospirales bacterium]|nr:lactonase family protein [Leptospirales bacterium]
MGLLSILVSRQAKYLYFSNSGGSQIMRSSIAADGSLASPVVAATLSGVTVMAVSPSGTMLAAAGLGPQALYFYRVNPQTGDLTFDRSDAQLLSAPSSIAFDPLNRYVAAVTSGAGGEMVCDTRSGALGTCNKFLTASGANIIALHPSGAFLYGLSTGANPAAQIFTVDASVPALNQVGVSSVFSGSGANDLTTDPAGQNIYAAFSTPGSGPYATAPLNGSTIGTISLAGILNGFSSLAHSPLAGYEFANQASNSLIMAIPRSASGLSLTPDLTKSLNVGGAPTTIRMDPQGLHIYVLNGAQIQVLNFGSVLSLASTTAVTAGGNGLALASYYKPGF